MPSFILWLFGLISLLLLGPSTQAQETALLRGQILDAQDLSPLPGATISLIIDGQILSSTLSQGDSAKFELWVPAEQKVQIRINLFGYNTLERRNLKLQANSYAELVFSLQSATLLDQIEIRPFEDREIDAQRMKREDLVKRANLTGNLESVLQFMAPGVSSGTGGELSSQYSVRGGNYDENLIYVNGFEIYRPLLIRAGQQEGLTFPNPDMLEALSFSSGGFKAQYDDKMSSVLDVQYRRPRKTEVEASGSFLGGSVYLGGAYYYDSLANINRRFSYTLGARYKTTQYLLNSLPIEGEYIPRFFDFQANLIADLPKGWQAEFLGNINTASFRLQPVSAATTTGLFNQALRLSSLFEGQEVSNFDHSMVGLALSYMPVHKTRADFPLRMRWQIWHYESRENERIDIENQYRLEEVQTGLGEENFGEVIGTLAYGTTHLFARNFLKIRSTNAQWRGAYQFKKSDVLSPHQHSSQWGLTYKQERIEDQLKEWTRFDSLGYTLPLDTTALIFPEYINSQANLLSHRFLGFAQHSYQWQTDKHDLRLVMGVRGQYWTLNREWLFSPRMQIYYTPKSFKQKNQSDTIRTRKTKDLHFKLAVGAYHQAPFYRELRNLQGELNLNVLAQRSVHIVGGMVWDFNMWQRSFKFVSEAYYKHQWNLVPYDVDNVRLRYYGDNLAKGYVRGLDLRLNGELVEGLESWVNLSLMQARESFYDVEHRLRRQIGFQADSLGILRAVIDTLEQNFVPKPTDQLALFSMVFQDDFPGASWCQANISLTVGTGFPFGIPQNNVEYRNVYRFNPYHRIDIGFLFMLWDRASYLDKQPQGLWAGGEADFIRKSKHFMRHFRSAWLSLEVFNLMGVSNVASNTWIKDFSNRSYAIPNFLTTRRINLRFRVAF